MKKNLASLILLTATVAQAQAPSLEKGFSDLVKKVGPGVVNISTFARPRLNQPGAGANGMNDDLFRRFFEDFFAGRAGPGGPGGGPNGPGDDYGDDTGDAPRGPGRRGKIPRGSKVQPLGLGTGFVLDANEGLVLTNFHVIDHSEEVKIQLEEDGEMFPADVVGKDPELDVALLKVKSKVKLMGIPLGDSEKIDVGEYVIAIGNPMGYGHTVSHGILSAKGRRNPEFRLGRYLQTDASINPGNSGGPLVNMKGEVIGINNAIDARAHGIGFAIPINLVKAVLPQLKAKGSVTRGFLGVSAGDLNSEMSEQLHLDPKLKGVLVVDVGHGTPAEKAGIKPYDVITAINGSKLLDSQDLTSKVTSVAVGTTIEVSLVRKGKDLSVKAVITERPMMGLNGVPGATPPREEKGAAKSADFKDFGFEVEELTADGGREFGIPPSAFQGKKLFVVVNVDEGQGAAASGLSPGDILMDIGGKEMKSMADVKAAMKLKGKSVLVRVRRFNQQGEGFVTVIVLTK